MASSAFPPQDRISDLNSILADFRAFLVIFGQKLCGSRPILGVDWLGFWSGLGVQSGADLGPN